MPKMICIPEYKLIFFFVFQKRMPHPLVMVFAVLVN